jgi:hypothetical protein
MHSIKNDRDYYSVVILFRITKKIVPLPSDSRQANTVAIKVCAEKDSSICYGETVKECQQMKPGACLVMLFMHKYKKQRVPIVMLGTFITSFLVTATGEKL